jgi:hypothetical protein
MYVCIMRQCFGVGTSYGSWLGLTTLAWGWDVTENILLPNDSTRIAKKISISGAHLIQELSTFKLMPRTIRHPIMDFFDSLERKGDSMSNGTGPMSKFFRNQQESLKQLGV